VTCRNKIRRIGVSGTEHSGALVAGDLQTVLVPFPAAPALESAVLPSRECPTGGQEYRPLSRR